MFSAVAAICWVVLQLSYGTLGPELKKAILGTGKSFRSDSTLPPLAQILIVLGAALLAAVGIYSLMKH